MAGLAGAHLLGRLRLGGALTRPTASAATEVADGAVGRGLGVVAARRLCFPIHRAQRTVAVRRCAHISVIAIALAVGIAATGYLVGPDDVYALTMPAWWGVLAATWVRLRTVMGVLDAVPPAETSA